MRTPWPRRIRRAARCSRAGIPARRASWSRASRTSGRRPFPRGRRSTDVARGPSAAGLSVPARLDIAEERAAFDELGDFRGDHAFPGVVVRGYPPQYIAAEDGQELGPVVAEVDEAAPPGEV